MLAATMTFPSSRRWRQHARIVAFAFVASLAAVGARAQDKAWESGTDGLAPIPKLAARATDETGTLSAADRQALEAKLADFEQRTGNQLVVLMVPSTKPEPIEAYSIRVAEAWKIGRKGQDNGALFVVAKDDRKMRIEVGYGLEGVLTDVTSRRIIAEDVAPLFRQNQFAAGVNAGVDRIIAVVGTGKPLPARSTAAPRRGQGFDFGTLLIFLFVGVPVVGGILARILGRTLGSTVGGGDFGQLRGDVRDVPVRHRRCLAATTGHEPDLLAFGLVADVVRRVARRLHAEQGGIHGLGLRHVGHGMQDRLDAQGCRHLVAPCVGLCRSL